MDRLTIHYDETCRFCLNCAIWLAQQAAGLPHRAGAESLLHQRFPELRTERDDLIVIGSGGEVFRDDAAFITALWALEEYREWSARLAAPALRKLARKGFERVSKRRHAISEWLGLKSDDEVKQALERVVGRRAPRCAIG